ncbi:MAG: aldo/keto reductase [Geitlerinemataceae cyanobacterium]
MSETNKRDRTKRRNFLLGGAAMLSTMACRAVGDRDTTQTSASAMPIDPDPDAAPPMPERVLGRTQVSVPLLGLGGAGKTPISDPRNEVKAIALIERALELGVRYFDTANSYGDSEAQFGQVLPAVRDRVYINTKTAASDYDGAWRHLESSLQRLNTDYIDGWQLHHVSFTNELDEIFSNTGAHKAMLEAKEQGLVRFLGITGHHEPDVIAEAIRRYEFDTTLITLNAADIHHPRPFSTGALPTARDRNVGVIAMKVPAYGRLIRPDLIDMEQAMGYSLSLPGVHCCVIAAENAEQLEFNVNIARRYQPLGEDAMARIAQRTVEAGEDGAFFRRWT